MGGVFTKQLRASVTHLVTNIIMSAKYEVHKIYIQMYLRSCKFYLLYK
jgi:hypothetical protein